MSAKYKNKIFLRVLRALRVSNKIFIVFILLLSTANEVEALQPGETAPDFTLQSQTLSELQGTVVYLDFWASWCTACKRSFPWMNKIQKKYSRDKFKVLAINLDEDPETSAQFLNQYENSLQILFDTDGKTPEQYEVQQMPSSYLIDKSGKIISIHRGFNEKTKVRVEKEIENLLREE